MTENFSQYKEKTYRMLRGLRKANSEKDPVCQELYHTEVPEKRNRVLLPKYGQTIITNCPKGGEIRKRKVLRHEVLWLEYEEEDWGESEVQTATEETTKTAFIEKKYLDTVVRTKITKQTEGFRLYSVDAKNGLKMIYDCQSNHSSRTRLNINDIGMFVKSTFSTGENKLSTSLTNEYSRVIHSETELQKIEAALFGTLKELLKIVSTDNCSPEPTSIVNYEPNKVEEQRPVTSTENELEEPDEESNDVKPTDEVQGTCYRTDVEIVTCNLQDLQRDQEDTNIQEVRNENTEANTIKDTQEPGDDDDDDGFMGGILGVYTRAQCDVVFV